jgi:hypothetical protein
MTKPTQDPRTTATLRENARDAGLLRERLLDLQYVLDKLIRRLYTLRFSTPAPTDDPDLQYYQKDSNGLIICMATNLPAGACTCPRCLDLAELAAEEAH